MLTLKTYLFLSLVFFIFLFGASLPYYSGDVKNHVVWAQSILDQGTYGFFERDFPGFAFPNYPPVAMLLFALSLATYNGVLSLVNWLNSNIGFFPSNLIYFFEWENAKIAFLKLPAIFANLLIAYLIFQLPLTKKFSFRKKLLISTIFLLNPATIYLSAVWGQIDLLPVAFLLTSIYLVLKKRIMWSGLLMSLALLSKQTSIIFLPVLLVWIFKDFGIKNTLKFLVLNILSVVLFYLPFHSPSIFWLLDLFRKNFDFVAHSVNENAINFWGLLYGFERASDEVLFGPLTMQHWGYLLFALVMGYPTYLFLKKRMNIESTFLYLNLISLSYFFFLTRMHERYLIPVIVFLIIISLHDKKYYIPLIFFSFLHFINLYRGLFQPDILFLSQLSNFTILLSILAIGYLCLLIYTFYDYIKNAN